MPPRTGSLFKHFRPGSSAGDHRSSRGILRESRCFRATSPVAGAPAGGRGAINAGGRHDRPDRAGAGAALRAAAEALVDLRGRAGAFRAGVEALPDDVLGQEIARADDHPWFCASDQNGIFPVSLTGPGHDASVLLPAPRLRERRQRIRAGACRTEPDPHPSTPPVRPVVSKPSLHTGIETTCQGKSCEINSLENI
jgi:hypothetical protein